MVRRRVALAFAVVPIANAIAAFAAFPVLLALRNEGGRLADPGQTTFGVAVVVGIVSVIVMLGGAVPAVAWLDSRRRLSLGPLAAFGAFLGNVPALLYVLPPLVLHVIRGTLGHHLLPASELIAGTLRVIAIGSAMGVWSALVFWVVGVRGSDGEVPPPA